MITIAQVATAMQTVLGPVADRAARATGFVQRQSKLTGARFVQTLVFGWLNQPQASLPQLAQAAATVGVPISPQGLDDRFGPEAAACVREVLEAAVRQVLATDPVAVPVLQRVRQVVVQDCTTISLPAALAAGWPGCGGRTPPAGAAALKLGVRLDLATGKLSGPHVEAGRTNDRATTVARLPLETGALRLADLGFFSLAELAEQDAAGVFWLTRLQAGTAVFTQDGHRQDLLPLLEAQGAAELDGPVLVGARQRLPCRLLAVRAPQGVADQRRRRLDATARAKGRAVNPITLALGGWTVLLTNVPAEQLTVREAVSLARARWQIEMVLPQMTKPELRAVAAGWQHVADLHLAVAHDHAVDEEFDQLPTLGEGGRRQPRPHGGTKLLNATGDAAEFQPLLGHGVQLALLGQQRRLTPVELLPLAFELGEPNHVGEVGLQQPLLLTPDRRHRLAYGGLARLEFLGEPGATPCPLQRPRHLGRVGQQRAQVLPDQVVQLLGRRIARGATVPVRAP